jgi:ABC-type sugar transport system substrate-binding protein
VAWAMENLLAVDPSVNVVYDQRTSGSRHMSRQSRSGRENDVLIVSVDGGCRRSKHR